MDYRTARKFWNSIVEYANAEASVAEEGNSGEFFVEGEYERRYAYASVCLESLRNIFHLHTGYLPVWDDKNNVWKLTKPRLW